MILNTLERWVTKRGARNIFGEGETAGDGETEFGGGRDRKGCSKQFRCAAAGPVMASPVIDRRADDKRADDGRAEVSVPVLVVARDLALLKLQLDGLHVSVTEEFTVLNMVVVSLNQRQIQALKSNANVLSISANRDLRTAALIYSAKGAPTLE